MLKKIPVSSLQGHQGPVTEVKYNINGEYCVSASEDKTVILWNPIDAIKLKVYQGHGQAVHDALPSHDNFHLASGSADRCSFYWDVATGSILRRFRGHDSTVNAVKFNKNSSILLSGGNDSTVRILDLKSRSYEPVQILDDAKDSITSIDISDDEIIVGSVDGWLRLYDIRMGKLHEDFLGEPLTHVCFSSDNQSVLISTMDSTLRLLDKTSGKLLNDYSGHTHTKFQLQSAPWFDDSCVLSACENSKIYLWDLIGGDIKQVLDLDSLTQTIAVHPNKYQLLTGSISGKINLWTVKGQKKTDDKDRAKSMSCWALPPR